MGKQVRRTDVISWQDCNVFSRDLQKRYRIRIRFECTPIGEGKYEGRSLWSVRAFRPGLGDEEQKAWQEWTAYPTAHHATVTGAIFAMLFRLEDRLMEEKTAAEQGRLFPA